MDIDALRQRIEQCQSQIADLGQKLEEMAEQEQWWVEKADREQEALETGGSRVARDVRELALQRTQEQVQKTRVERGKALAQQDRLERDLGRLRAELDRAEFLVRHRSEPGQDPLADAAAVTDDRVREAEALASVEAQSLPAAREKASRLVGGWLGSRAGRAALAGVVLVTAVLGLARYLGGPQPAAARLVAATADPAATVRPVVYISIQPLRDLGPDQRIAAVADLLAQLPADLRATEVEVILGSTADRPRARLLGIIRVNIDHASLPAPAIPAILGQTAADPRLEMIQTLGPLVTGRLDADTLTRVLGDLAGDARLTALQVLAPRLATPPTPDQRDALLDTLDDAQQIRAAALLMTRP